MKAYLFLALFLPFLGALILALAGRHLPRRGVEALACSTILISFLTSLLALISSEPKAQTVILLPWIYTEGFSAPMSVLYDPLAGIMAVMVTFVSALIHLYSVSFMRDDEGYVRYFCYLNLFVFAMLVVTLADNLLFLYLGWEGVGFCSYALIGFWHSDEVRAAAGRKAFILTRIGDVALGIAIALFFALYRDLSLATLNLNAPRLDPSLATALGLLLLWAAVGKSAQLPLAVWLPDAMAGPTPVSALIHAATMVTAGVYLLMRFFPVISLSPAALLAIAAVGAVTSLLAACAALAQRDIKLVLAYSTISQVSYMFLGVGAGDVAGSMFHLLSHAFFKALLFLAAGCIIQALREEHDIFRMGGLRLSLPAVFILFLAGTLSLAGIPPFGGFFSKDQILLAAFNHPEGTYQLLWVLGEVTAFLTALYSFRLFFLVFGEKPASDSVGNLVPQEVGLRPLPKLMIWVLWPLAFLSLAAGALNLPELLFGREWLAGALEGMPGAVPRIKSSPGAEAGIMAVSGFLSVAAAAWAYFIYRRRPSEVAANSFRQKMKELSFSAFYLDQWYQKAIVTPYLTISRFLWLKVDEGAVDGGIDGAGRWFPSVSQGLHLWATGRLSTYLKMLFLGFTALLVAMVMGWSPWN
jgi:NADH-quinone oxidoreductase subunit L